MRGLWISQPMPRHPPTTRRMLHSQSISNMKGNPCHCCWILLRWPSHTWALTLQTHLPMFLRTLGSRIRCVSSLWDQITIRTYLRASRSSALPVTMPPTMTWWSNICLPSSRTSLALLTKHIASPISSILLPKVYSTSLNPERRLEPKKERMLMMPQRHLLPLPLNLNLKTLLNLLTIQMRYLVLMKTLRRMTMTTTMMMGWEMSMRVHLRRMWLSWRKVLFWFGWCSLR